MLQKFGLAVHGTESNETPKVLRCFKFIKCSSFSTVPLTEIEPEDPIPVHTVCAENSTASLLILGFAHKS